MEQKKDLIWKIKIIALLIIFFPLITYGLNTLILKRDIREITGVIAVLLGIIVLLLINLFILLYLLRKRYKHEVIVYKESKKVIPKKAVPVKVVPKKPVKVVQKPKKVIPPNKPKPIIKKIVKIKKSRPIVKTKYVVDDEMKQIYK
ncbi:hypothetical protein ACFLZX_03475 [Nanoarchaeota archaeon]